MGLNVVLRYLKSSDFCVAEILWAINVPESSRCWQHHSNYQIQGSKLRGAEGQNAPKLSPNAPRLLNLGAKFCYPIQPDICFEA